MSIHVRRAPTVPLTSYDTKRSSHLKNNERKFQITNFIKILGRITHNWIMNSFFQGYFFLNLE